MPRRKWVWNDQNTERAKIVLEVANELRNWWPLTLRQLFYRVLAKGCFLNPAWQKNGGKSPLKNPYGALSTLLKWMRIDEKLPWNALEDRSRSISDKRGFSDLSEFINQEMSWFLEDYQRCLIQGQENHIELWTEKDALAKIFQDVAYPYCLRTVVCRGYSSITFIADFYRRASNALNQGQTPIVLYFGDLDPSGVDMLEATKETLEAELGLEGVVFKRIALNPDQVKKYNLPQDPTAAKTSDKRFNKYVEKYGRKAVELDALHPDQLSKIAEDAIESVVDMEFFGEQKQMEKIERKSVALLKNDVEDYIYDKIREFRLV
jgi:hypothetical protein